LKFILFYFVLFAGVDDAQNERNEIKKKEEKKAQKELQDKYNVRVKGPSGKFYAKIGKKWKFLF
jgi:hypothetical protein